MDDIIKPGRSPCPRRQNTALKALCEDAPATENGATTEAPRHDDEANRPPREGQVGDTPEMPAWNSGAKTARRNGITAPIAARR